MTDPNHIAEARKKVSRPQIREVFVRNGAVIPAERDDLPDYVYESVFELLEMAAPAVQGEPVGEVRFELGAPSSIFAELYSKSLPVLAPGTKLYTAPQPAEQQPAELEILGSYPVSGQIFFRESSNEWVLELTGSVNGTRFTARHTQPADTRPEDVAGLPALYELAPDVAGLGGALEYAIETLDDCDMNLFHNVIEVGRAALAAHRSQGGEQ